MGSIVKCFLQTTKTLLTGRYTSALVHTHVLLQNVCVNWQLILFTRSFTFCQNHACPNSKQPLLSTIEQREEKEFDADRLKKISGILNCSVEKAQMLCNQHDFLNEMSLNKLQKKVDLIVSYDVPYAVIRTHLRVARHVSMEVLSERLKLLHKLSLLNHRHAGFYLYCTKKELEQGLSYVQECKQALEGCDDMVEYTQHRLNVSEERAKNFLSTTPFMKGYSPIRLKKHFDFFHFEAKVSSKYLLQNFVLFNYSPERLRYRLKIMRRAGIKEPYVWNKFWRYTPHHFYQGFAKHIKETA